MKLIFGTMKFYKLCYPVDSEDVGNVSSQLGKIVKNSIPFLQNIDFSKETNITESPIFNIEPKAKLSNFLSLPVLISSTPNLLIVDLKTKHLIEKFVLPKFKSFDILIFDKKNYQNYYLLHIFDKDGSNQFVDYEKTEFAFEMADYFAKADNIEVVRFKNLDDYVKSLRNNFFNSNDNKIKYGRYNVKKLVFKNEVVDTDIFYLSSVCPGIYVSERLKSAIERNILTGIRFIAVEDIVQPIPILH